VSLRPYRYITAEQIAVLMLLHGIAVFTPMNDSED